MHILEATYRIVTPMFIGDANQQATGIRPPSVKGALRFWWRALNWGRCLRERDGDETAALGHLHEEEKRLFGSAAAIKNDEQIGGQGCFLLQVSAQPKLLKDSAWPQNNTGSGYLGFGILESGNIAKGNYQPHRDGIREDSDFSLRFIFKPNTKTHDIESITEVIQIWGLCGGLGSRSRRGFGSVTLLNLNGDSQLKKRTDYERMIQEFLSKSAMLTEYPPFTAFSSKSSFSIITEGANARNVHNQAGIVYKNYRGQFSSLKGPAKIPFGLPLQDEDSRRASPLIFHIHELESKLFVAMILYLPAEFHSHYPQSDLDSFYRVVADFIDTARNNNP